MAEMLTKDYVAGKKIVFFPKSPAEAETIQRHLFKMGYTWRKGETEPLYLDVLSTSTLILQDGKMHYNPGKRDAEGGELFGVSQLDPNYIADDREFLKSLFNKVHERLDKIEKRIEVLEAAVTPKRLDKPQLKAAKP